MPDSTPATAAGIPYEDTDCTADEAVEAVKAVRTTAAPWRCRYGHPDCIVHPGVEAKPQRDVTGIHKDPATGGDRD